MILPFSEYLKSHFMSVHIIRESGCTHTQRCVCVCALMHGGAEPPAHTVGLKCTEINWKVKTVKIFSARAGPSFSSALSGFLHVSARAKGRVCCSLNFQFCWYFRAGTLWVSIFWITVRRTHRATSLNKFLCSRLSNPFLVPGSSSQGRRAELLCLTRGSSKGRSAGMGTGTSWLLVSLGEEP